MAGRFVIAFQGHHEFLLLSSALAQFADHEALHTGVRLPLWSEVCVCVSVCTVQSLVTGPAAKVGIVYTMPWLLSLHCSIVIEL